MSEERLQEIKDSISLQYKVQEANDLNNFNIFTDEEQELVEEIERLNNIIKRLEEFIEKEIELYTIELTEENERKLSIVAPIKGVYKEIYNVLQELKGSDK